MPKTKPTLLDQAKGLAVVKEKEGLLRRISQLEQQVATAEAEKKFQAAKAAQTADELRSMKERWEALIQAQDKRTAKKLSCRMKQSPRNATAVICLSDWHAEENIDPNTLDGANEFNLEIAFKRISRTYQKSLYLLEFARHVARIDELIIWLGGDLINGAIHEEAEESNFLGPAEAAIWIQDRVSEGLDLFLREAKVNRILVATNYGNHGRITKKKRRSTGFMHSLEWLAYSNLERMWCKEGSISWKIERGYHNWVTIQGWNVRFHHGDECFYWGGSGGITIPVRKAIAQWNKRKWADLDVLGHFHHFVDDWYFVVSGCLCGYNAYGQAIKAEFQPPTQTFLLIDKEYGKVMALPIFCAEVDQT